MNQYTKNLKMKDNDAFWPLLENEILSQMVHFLIASHNIYGTQLA